MIVRLSYWPFFLCRAVLSALLVVALSFMIATPMTHAAVPASALLPEIKLAAQPPLFAAQYNAPPRRPPFMRPPRALPPVLRGRPRPPVAPRRGQRARPAIPPSEALRLAQRRWPSSIGLSVRLLRRHPPVYAVKLKTGGRVVQVLVDASTGRVMQ